MPGMPGAADPRPLLGRTPIPGRPSEPLDDGHLPGSLGFDPRDWLRGGAPDGALPSALGWWIVSRLASNDLSQKNRLSYPDVVLRPSSPGGSSLHSSAAVLPSLSRPGGSFHGRRGNTVTEGPAIANLRQPRRSLSTAANAAVGHAKQFVNRNIVLAIPALVVACVGAPTFGCAPVGAILGHVARSQIRRNGQTGGGFALAAIIVGWTITGLYVCGLGIPIVLILLKAGTLAAIF